jgi:putative MFS transporter
MFVIAGVPVVFISWWRRQLPESPCRLVRIGKAQQAEQALAKIEREVARSSKSLLPEPTPGGISEERSASRVPITSLFRGRVALRRTLVAAGIWTIAVCASAG